MRPSWAFLALPSPNRQKLSSWACLVAEEVNYGVGEGLSSSAVGGIDVVIVDRTGGLVVVAFGVKGGEICFCAFRRVGEALSFFLGGGLGEGGI